MDNIEEIDAVAGKISEFMSSDVGIIFTHTSAFIPGCTSKTSVVSKNTVTLHPAFYESVLPFCNGLYTLDDRVSNSKIAVMVALLQLHQQETRLKEKEIGFFIHQAVDQLYETSETSKQRECTENKVCPRFKYPSVSDLERGLNLCIVTLLNLLRDDDKAAFKIDVSMIKHFICRVRASMVEEELHRSEPSEAEIAFYVLLVYIHDKEEGDFFGKLYRYATLDFNGGSCYSPLVGGCLFFPTVDHSSVPKINRKTYNNIRVPGSDIRLPLYTVTSPWSLERFTVLKLPGNIGGLKTAVLAGTMNRIHLNMFKGSDTLRLIPVVFDGSVSLFVYSKLHIEVDLDYYDVSHTPHTEITFLDALYHCVSALIYNLTYSTHSIRIKAVPYPFGTGRVQILRAYIPLSFHERVVQDEMKRVKAISALDTQLWQHARAGTPFPCLHWSSIHRLTDMDESHFRFFEECIKGAKEVYSNKKMEQILDETKVNPFLNKICRVYQAYADIALIKFSSLQCIRKCANEDEKQKIMADLVSVYEIIDSNCKQTPSSVKSGRFERYKDCLSHAVWMVDAIKYLV